MSDNPNTPAKMKAGEAVACAGHKLVSGTAYGQRYVSLITPDGKIIMNAYEQGAPQMFAFLAALAQQQAQPVLAPQAMPLTEEQIDDLIRRLRGSDFYPDGYGIHDVIRWTEKSHGIGDDTKAAAVVSEDARMLDWLDGNAKRFHSGWRCGVAPAGNVRLEMVGMRETTFREAIAPATPPGWKLVPVEPTPLMLMAFYEGDRYSFTTFGDRYLAMLNAAPSPAPGTVGWRPIETAPKDGTLVDLFADGVRLPDCWFREADDADCEPTWMQRYAEASTSFSLLGFEPTHWMPLPLPPTAVVAEEGRRT